MEKIKSRKISVVVPMFNEEENVEHTILQITSVLNKFQDWELIIVDDGSSDSTPMLVEKIAKRRPNIHLFRHPRNLGVGRALRTGFSHATGDIIVTIDADLSYAASEILTLIEKLDAEEADIVLGSPYTKGGKTVKVPFHRLIISKAGNYFLRFVLNTNIKCLTSIFRAYRREVIDSLELVSDGKEIEPEIVAKAIAMGFRVVEVPAKLRGRTRGRSKFKFGESIWLHLKFSLNERPMILFSFVGLFIAFLGFLFGLDLVWRLYFEKEPILRPMLILTVLLLIMGLQTIIFGFLADQITLIRSELLRVRREIKKRMSSV